MKTRQRKRPCSIRSGFTLIEVLAAVAILVILVGIVTTVFTESDRAWTLGTGRAMNNSEGRSAVNMIAHDLQYAAADGVLSFSMGPDRYATDADPKGAMTYGIVNDEICCVSLQHDSSGNAPRTAREIYYFVRETNTTTALGKTYKSYELVRDYYGTALVGPQSKDHCYGTNTWYRKLPRSGDIIAQNVVGFHALAGPPALLRGLWDLPHAYESIAPANSNALPQFVDIYIEVLNERDMAEVAKMTTSPRDYIERNVKRYTTRVYLQNRMGYKVREGRALGKQPPPFHIDTM